MEILSSSKNIVLSNLSNLETKFIYKKDVEACDFQFFGVCKFLVAVNKKVGLEILHVSSDIISRFKKIKFEHIYSVASPKQISDDIALGLLDGQIKFLNRKTLQICNKFSKDSSQSSVLYLDYNPADEYLLSVLESGRINVFGMKTNKKIETLDFDKSCTLSKFHPIKKCNLATATYKGGVYMYDLQTKSSMYSNADAHAAPCRDICMCAAKSNLLISAGFDCLINIFDIRRKSQSLKIICESPLSTVSVSDCGSYICVGNLKGEITAYDVRNTKNYLYSKKAHDDTVTRVAFVPDQKINESVRKSLLCMKNERLDKQSHASVEDKKSSEFQIGSCSNITSNTDKRRDSFFDFLDNYGNQNQRTSNRFSFGLSNWNTDDLKLNKDINSKKSETRDLKKKEMKLQNVIQELTENEINFSEINRKDSTEKLTTNENYVLINKTPIVISSCDNSINNQNVYSTDSEKVIAEIESDKENLCVKDIEEFSKLPDHKNSTPNSHNVRVSKKSNTQQKEKGKVEKLIDTDILIRQMQTMQISLMNEIKNLRKEMDNKFDKLENELNFTAETNKWEIINQNAHLFSQQSQVNQEVEEALLYILKSDKILNEYLILKKENEKLKIQLNALCERAIEN